MKNQGEYNTDLNDKKYKTDYKNKTASPYLENTDAYTYTPKTHQNKIELEKQTEVEKLVIKEKTNNDILHDINKEEEEDGWEIYEPKPRISHSDNDISTLNLQKLLQDKKEKDKKNIKLSLIMIFTIAFIFFVVFVAQKTNLRYGTGRSKDEKDLSVEVIKFVEHYKVAFPNVVVNTKSTDISNKEISIYLSSSEEKSEKKHPVNESYELMIYTIEYIIENNTFTEDNEKTITVNINDIDNSNFEVYVYKSKYKIENEINLYGTEGFSRWQIEFSPNYALDEIILRIVIGDDGEVIDDFTGRPLDLTPYMEKYDRDVAVAEEYERKRKIDNLK